MAKSLKSILGNDKKLEGVKSSTKSKVDLGAFTPRAAKEREFVAKHDIEKFADRAGNSGVPYTPTTKEAPFQKQDEKVYEDAMSDTEGLQAYAPQGSVPASSDAKKKKKSITERVEETLETLSKAETIFKFKNGEKELIDESVAANMLKIFTSLTEENKTKFAEIAFNSPEEFYSISDLKG